MATGNSSPKLRLSLTNLEPLNFLEINEGLDPAIVEEGDNITFECVVSAYPLPRCTWYKNGEPITINQRIKITSYRRHENTDVHKLQVKNVSIADEGIYSVTFRTEEHQTISKANLFVAVKNVRSGVFYTTFNNKCFGLIQHLRNVRIDEGNRIYLYAVFDASATNIIWYKHNQRIDRNERTIIRSANQYSTLTVFDSRLDDSGVYYVVAKICDEVVSSFANVEVVSTNLSNSEDTKCPTFIEELPKFANGYKSDTVRLICKADINNYTSVKWKKNGALIKASNFTQKEYDAQNIGLEGVMLNSNDAGEYSVTLINEMSGEKATSICDLTVTPLPDAPKEPPVVSVKSPLRSVVAQVGSKVLLNCSFDLNDPTFCYVVWQCGPYTIERSNNQFSVICSGNEFLLYINKLEPEMGGKVTCELRKALPDQTSFALCSNTAYLAIVPNSFILQEKMNNVSLDNGRLFQKEFIKDEKIIGAKDSMTIESKRGKKILEVSFCLLNKDDTYFFDASTDATVEINSEPTTTSVTITFDTTDQFPDKCWFRAFVRTSDGSYTDGGECSSPQIEIRDPQLNNLMVLRLHAIPPPDELCEAKLCFVPNQEENCEPHKCELRALTYFNEEYNQTGTLLGSGLFGLVTLARKTNGKHYACKIIKADYRKDAMHEYKLMSKIRHPKLIQLIEGFYDTTSFVIVMEYLWGGELFVRIVEQETDEDDVVIYLRQICDALVYLHRKGIVHLDIKPQNIMCESPNSYNIKLIDFGIAKVVESGSILKTFHGTKNYMPPEILDFEKITTACDMWSLGVVTYIMLSGIEPFYAESWIEKSFKIAMADYNYDDPVFDNVSWLSKSFVDRLLVIKPRERMTAEQALEHDWLKFGPPKSTSSQRSFRRIRENLKTFVAAYRSKWQLAGNVMIAALRMRCGNWTPPSQIQLTSSTSEQWPPDHENPPHPPSNLPHTPTLPQNNGHHVSN